MGHLFSRAIKRFTQCSQSRGLTQQQQQQAEPSSRQQEQQQQPAPPTRTVTSETIPVGQSIDSGDFYNEPAPTLSAASLPKVGQVKATIEEEAAREEEEEVAAAATAAGAASAAGTGEDENSKPKQADEVEEAVIKIQAYVRGHLTRKALRDAQQHSAPNALGQSQFDVENLTRDPPSSVFSLISPRSAPVSPGDAKKTLESIAEDVESALVALQRAPAPAPAAKTPPPATSPEGQQQQAAAKGSMSPALSEAAASIDLNCDTPASASIDIVDHHSRDSGAKMATILHPSQPERTREPATNTNGAPTRPTNVRITMTQSADLPNDSSESEEAAAIRIQSAFRGYRTRKNSPYRTRSPSSPTSLALSNGDATEQLANARRKALKQQEATEEEAELRAEEEEEKGEATGELVAGRRQSRARHRDSIPEEAEEAGAPMQAAPSLDEFTTEESTVREAAVLGAEPACLEDGSSLLTNLSSEPSRLQSLEAALEMADSSSQAAAEGQLSRQRNSEVSVELDTDSSNLGALASFNDEAAPGGGCALEAAADDRSLGVSLPTDSEMEAEAARLIDELEELPAPREERALAEATSQLEEALEAASAPELELEPQSSSRAEMESDDIERRDPRGQASGASESPAAAATPETPDSRCLLSPGELEERHSNSGRSSGCGSSEEDDEEEAEAMADLDEGQQRRQAAQQQQQTQQTQQQRKRRNRNRKNKANKK